MSELTPKQEMFCKEYLVDLNATQAAIRAGYSKKTAMEQGYQLLQKTSVQAKIQAFMNKRSERTEVTADEILRELLSIAKVDIGEAYGQNGELLPIHQIPPHIRKAISSIDVFEEFAWNNGVKEHVGDTKRLKFWDKPKALELLGRHLKLFTDKVEHSGQVSLSQLVESSIKE